MTDAPSSPDITPATLLLTAAANGDRAAADQLLPLVYEQLRKAAQKQLASERAGQTLTATALVHEAYLKLIGPRQLPWAGSAHFYGAAAQAMRRILIDRARARYGHDGVTDDARRAALTLSGLESLPIDEPADGLLALDDAMVRIEAVDSQAAAVVRLRFYAGLDIEQTAAVLGVSPRTVKRDWAFARGWLRNDLGRTGTG